MNNRSSGRVRRWIVVVLTLLLFGIFAARLIKIQVVDAEEYQRKMEGISLSSQMRKAVRGEIMDRNGNPIIINEMGYSVIIDRPFLPRGDEQNQVLLRLVKIFEDLGEEWIDNLPISKTEPYTFLENTDDEQRRLREHLDTQPYVSAEEMVYWLVERYSLEDFTPAEARTLAGIRYEMERRDFSMRIPYTFANDISKDTVIYLRERSFELPGITPEPQAIRKFAADDLAPHILGHIGPLYAEEYSELKKDGKIFKDNAPDFDTRGYTMDDIIGKGGIEEALEDTLRGYNGKREITTDAQGSVVEAFDSIPPVPGNTVYLTLDEDLQRLAQDALEAQIHFLRTSPTAPVEARDADAGAIVVLEVKTGKILAMASYPTYTLTDYRNNYQEVASREGSPLLDRAAMTSYSPGSIYKPVTALTALTEGVAEPYTTFVCNGVYEHFASSGYRPTCLGYHGNINVINALRESCNIYFYEAGRQSGIEAIDSIAQRLGLGEPTGIEISENIGQRSNPETKRALGEGDWYPADTVQVAIGQFHNQFSTLQFANYVSTIANRGVRMELSLIEEIRDYSRAQVVQRFEPTVAYDLTQDIDPEHFETIIEGMVQASHVGTARGTFGNYPISVASKTGTPQTGGGDVNSTFLAFAPAEDPEIAIAVVIEDGWHGYTGASVTKAIFDEYFGIEDVWAPILNGPDQMKRERLAQAAEGDDGAGDTPRKYTDYTLPEEELPPSVEENYQGPLEPPMAEESTPDPVTPPPEDDSSKEDPPAKTESTPEPTPSKEGEVDKDINVPPSRKPKASDDSGDG